MSDMSFLAPARLALLALPLLLALGYVLLQVRRRRYAIRFTTLDLLDEVAPDKPGWRRHLTACGLLVSVVVATLAFARPVIAGEQVEAQQLVVLAIDTSLSMEADDVAPSRLQAAQEAAGVFLDTVPDGVAVGVVGFDTIARQLITPTTRLEAVQRVIDRVDLGEGTAIGEAVFVGIDAIDAAANLMAAEELGAAPPAGTIVLLSDGETTSGRPNDEAAAEARRRGIPVHTIAFGTDRGTISVPGAGEVPVPVNDRALDDLARRTDGRSLEAATAAELSQVYEDLGRTVQVETVRTEVSDWFAGFALVLLFLAGLGSLMWFGRLP